MHHQIVGEFAQYLKLTLDRGESCWAARGAIMSHDQGIHWQVRAPGGVGGTARRLLSGEAIALARFEATRPGATVSLANSQSGTTSLWNLDDGPVLTTRGAFLAAWGDIDIDVTIARRAGAAAFGDTVDYDVAYVGGVRKALFSGEGLFMTTLTGQARYCCRP
jgi:uncharacterized protein (AIM24 family)